jgi:class 3 adenylate cyclase
LPDADPQHAEHSVACAKEFVEYIQKHNETSSIQLKVRAGVSSGSVIAGIVGIKKYIYDIFGDTVNTAYRMKGLSSAMQIKVSPDTYKYVKDKFKFLPQTPIEVKGKGQMETYNLDI